MIDLLPWHRQPLSELLARRSKMPHALLIHGNQGIGKVEFAKAIAQSLLCEADEDGIACGKCSACGWFRDGNHPDFRALVPDILAEETVDLEALTEDADKKEEKKSKEISYLHQYEIFTNMISFGCAFRLPLYIWLRYILLQHFPRSRVPTFPLHLHMSRLFKLGDDDFRCLLSWLDIRSICCLDIAVGNKDERSIWLHSLHSIDSKAVDDYKHCHASIRWLILIRWLVLRGARATSINHDGIFAGVGMLFSQNMEKEEYLLVDLILKLIQPGFSKMDYVKNRILVHIQNWLLMR